jgi:hypothetical protein
VGGSGSKNSDPAEGQGDKEVTGSQLPEPFLTPKPHVGSQSPEPTQGPVDRTATGSQLPEAALSPENQEAIGSQLLEATSGPGG